MTMVLISIVPNLSWGQYTYFETTSSQSLNGWAENLGALEIFEGRYFTWGIGIGTLQGEQEDRYFIQECDSLGQYVDGLNIYLPDQFLYTGVTNTFQKDMNEEAFYAMGTKVDTVSTKGYVMKASTDLDTIWTKEYTMYEPDTQIDASAPSDNGGLYLAGSFGVAPGERGTYIAEIDANGNVLWHQTIHEPNEGVFRNRYISRIPSGFIVSGSEGVAENTIGRLDFLDENGLIQWEQEGINTLLGGGGMNHFVKSNGEVLAFQHVRYEDYPDISDPYWAYAMLRIYEIDLDNQTISNSHDFLTNNEMIRGGPIKILEAQEESLVIAGVYEETNVGGELPQMGYVLKINNAYELEWFTELAFNDCAGCLNVLWDMVQAPDGGYTMAGYFQDPNGSDPYSKTWLVKVDACGDIEYNGCWPLGIREFEMQDLKFEVFPNPASDVIQVTELENEQEIQGIEIHNNLGQVVYQNNVLEERIDISKLPPGAYQLLLKTKDSKNNTKFIIEY